MAEKVIDCLVAVVAAALRENADAQNHVGDFDGRALEIDGFVEVFPLVRAIVAALRDLPHELYVAGAKAPLLHAWDSEGECITDDSAKNVINAVLDAILAEPPTAQKGSPAAEVIRGGASFGEETLTKGNVSNSRMAH